MNNPHRIGALIDSTWLSKIRDKYPMLHHFDDLLPRVVPPPPEELVDFRKATRGDRETKGPKFYSQDFIKDYLDMKWEIEVHNKSNYFWCKDLAELAKDNPVIKDRILKKMGLFRQTIMNTDTPYRSLRINWPLEPAGTTEKVIEDLNNWN